MFAILFEVLLIEIQEEIHHFAGWEGGGSRGTKIVNKHFVNKLAFPNYTHEIIIFKLFMRLQLQLSGVFRINYHYSYSLLIFLAEWSYRK